MHNRINAITAGKGWIIVILSVIALAGCSMGPQVMKGNRLDYNVSIQKSNNEELLLNIVRARYAEPLFFLQVGSISSSFGYSTNMGITGSLFERSLNQTFLNVVTPSLSGVVSENPTITYAPLQGEKMVKQLQSELQLDRFLTLMRTGFSIDAVMWLTVLQIGDLTNFHPDVSEQSLRSYSKFLDLAHSLNAIKRRGDLEFVNIKKNEAGVPGSLTMQLRYLDKGEADRIEGLLGVKPERTALQNGRLVSAIELTPVHDFMTCQTKGDCSRVFVKLKSYQQIIYDMAMKVEVLDDDQSARRTIPVKSSMGEMASRDGIHAGLFKVKSQSAQPVRPFVAVPYRDRWFYIDDEDVKTKTCFMILSTIYSLQSGDLQATVPVLTLPVGR